MKIAKEFRWEMGHRLSFHKGKCKNLHGHSYKLWIELNGIEDSNGLLMDYYDLAKLVLPVLENIDHCFMVSIKDTNLIEALKKLDSKSVIVDFEPTAENICKYILNEIKHAKLPENIKSVTARVYETDDDFAEDEVEV
jgi:6-pyruvoyltetrahydropterin/6-carboxytetrahydropterin synthase